MCTELLSLLATPM